ncbi:MULTISPECIES: acetate--CoA ligase family protein [unclassified Microbacterium]|uniref:acetate--CoA ligase family protein n=1 Tax=unclassified Microbacterium TaxID=2609290 RepID=UPI00214C0555|nr:MULTISPECIES: acetate--CoA ligase family protein [unclassified Microbacterium]MCR2811379.1 acetate--CoA ligase family protein [Microbacterium sp. zg.B185]WIM19575.1 acetate--CoA ligase family protein [Microbacterium sp. zg-B185]
MDAIDRRVFDAIFTPSSIALIGASGDAKKNTARPQRMLRDHGYQGRILPINPTRSEVMGERAYPSVLDAPGDIDHAFIMVPAPAVLDAVIQCGQRGIPVATVYTDGFAEISAEGAALQDEIARVARESGMRLLGPNCSGIYSSKPRVALSVNAAIEKLDITPGPLAIISQSGSMTGGLVSRGLGRGVGFSRVVSIGNESDLATGELVDWLVDDPETGAILLFIETLRDADRLALAARRAIDAGKPVIAYKVGRSDLGRDLAASHTGAIASADEVADAHFRANGILRVDNLEAMFELPAMLTGHRPSARHRVAVMSTTGGGAATVVDRLGTLGVEVVAPTDQVVDNLAAQGVSIPRGKLTDLTNAGTKAEIYGAVLDELLASDHCDLVLAVAGSSAQFYPEITVGPAVRADRHGKPLAMFIAPHAERALQQLAEAGAAGFRTPEATADAIHAWSQWNEPVAPAQPDPAIRDAVRAVLNGVASGQLSEWDSTSVLSATGIPFAPTAVLRGANDVAQLAFPVVAKVLSADIAHKTDAGGVIVGIQDLDALVQAAAEIRRRVAESRPDAAVDGILVQQMEKGLAEVILGFRRDPLMGPVVVLGMGGVLAELYGDAAIRLAPVTLAEARAMVDEVRGLAVIRGYRSLPKGDRDALEAAIIAMSQLASVAEPVIAEAEINPLLVRADGQGVVAVDGLVVLA